MPTSLPGHIFSHHHSNDSKTDSNSKIPGLVLAACSTASAVPAFGSQPFLISLDSLLQHPLKGKFLDYKLSLAALSESRVGALEGNSPDEQNVLLTASHGTRK